MKVDEPVLFRAWGVPDLDSTCFFVFCFHQAIQVLFRNYYCG